MIHVAFRITISSSFGLSSIQWSYPILSRKPHSFMACRTLPPQSSNSLMRHGRRGVTYAKIAICLALLGVAMYGVIYAQTSITVKVHADGTPSPTYDVQRLPISAPGATRQISLSATANPYPSDLTWQWSSNAVSGPPSNKFGHTSIADRLDRR